MATQTTEQRLSESEHELRDMMSVVVNENRAEPAGHDLRNALSVIGTYRDLMSDPTQDESELIDDIEKALQYAQRTIDRIVGIAVLVVQGTTATASSDRALSDAALTAVTE